MLTSVWTVQTTILKCSRNSMFLVHFMLCILCCYTNASFIYITHIKVYFNYLTQGNYSAPTKRVLPNGCCMALTPKTNTHLVSLLNMLVVDTTLLNFSIGIGPFPKMDHVLYYYMQIRPFENLLMNQRSY